MWLSCVDCDDWRLESTALVPAGLGAAVHQKELDYVAPRAAWVVLLLTALLPVRFALSTTIWLVIFGVI